MFQPHMDTLWLSWWAATPGVWQRSRHCSRWKSWRGRRWCRWWPARRRSWLARWRCSDFPAEPSAFSFDRRLETVIIDQVISNYSRLLAISFYLIWWRRRGLSARPRWRKIRGFESQHFKWFSLTKSQQNIISQHRAKIWTRGLPTVLMCNTRDN